jgi:hypothetical protein
MQIQYITNQLFDCDSTTLEYALSYGDIDPADTAQTTLWMRIMREDGTELLYLPGHTLPEGNTDFVSTNTKAIHNDPAGAVMGVLHGWNPLASPRKYYRLCGTLPTNRLGAGNLTGLWDGDGSEIEGAHLYPNPASEFIKIKYDLPQGSAQGTLRVFDMNGKLQLEKQLGDYFDHINLDISSLSQGTYLINILLDDDKVINEKFIKVPR